MLLLLHEREVSCFTIFFNLCVRPATILVYSIKFLVFNFLGTYFVKPKSDDLHENQPVLRLLLDKCSQKERPKHLLYLDENQIFKAFFDILWNVIRVN